MTRTARLACSLMVVCIGLGFLCTAEAVQSGSLVNCTVVQCFVDPCTTTTCTPTNTDWECVANYCGGCNTDWKNKKTGLKISTCPPDACTEIFDPVCGVDGKTYSSSCHALLVGVKVAYKGECKTKCNIVQCLIDPCTSTQCKPANPDWKCVANYCNGCNTDWLNTKTGLKISTCPPDVCPKNYAPVCGTNLKTYSNDCEALRNGIKVKHEGPCKCSKTKRAPVCGKDGVSYRNRCLAYKNGTTVAYNGTCSFPTKCAKFSKKYNPVCDNVTKLTWANICVAKLNNAATTPGPCIGPICARCTEDSGCNAPHRCKGNKKYTCEIAGCEIQHVLDNGKRVTYGLCSPIYKNKATGYPAAACYP